MNSIKIKLFFYTLIVVEILLIINTFFIKFFLNYDKVLGYISDKAEVDFFGYIIPKSFILEYAPSYEFLTKYNNLFGWYHDHDIEHSFYYLNHLIFLIIFLLGLIFFSKKVDRVLDNFINWAKIQTQVRPRQIIFFSTMFLIFIFLTKAHTVLFFGGISGWDHSEDKSIIQSLIQHNEDEIKKESYYHKAINYKNASFVNKNGYLNGPAFFMHFQEGEVLPFNMGILNMVFPDIQYPISSEKSFIDSHTQCRLIKQIMYGLDNSKKGESFFYKIRYPNHTPYQKIIYSNYPNSKKLDSISIHTIYLKIDNRRVSLIGGKQIKIIKCLDIKK